MTVRIGLVGLGMMGTTHFKGYKEIDNADIVALCDIQPQRLKGDFSGTAGNIDTGSAELEDVAGMKTYRQFGKLIRNPDVDLVDICLPSYMHARMTTAALQAGKHVFCEKPMAMSYKQACRMSQAAREAGKHLMIGQCLRFWPEYVLIKQIIDSGRFGRARSAVLRRLGAPPTWSWQNWLFDTKKSGSCALDLHIHDVDTLNWFFGKPAKVFSQGTPTPDGGVGHILTQYFYEDGPVAFADGSWDFHGAYPFSMSASIVFESGTVDYNSSATPTLAIYTPDGAVETPSVSQGSAYTEELRYFVGCIESGTAPDRVPNESAALAVAIVAAEIRSTKSGRPAVVNV